MTMKRITDPTFRYTTAVNTDIRKGFDRVRKGLPYRADGPVQTPTHISEFERRRKEALQATLRG